MSGKAVPRGRPSLPADPRPAELFGMAGPGPRPPTRRKPSPTSARRVPAKPPAPQKAGRKRREPTSDSAEIHLVETVRFHIYDVGRAVNLKKVAALIPAHDDLGILKRRDTPASITLPKPLVLSLGEAGCVDRGSFECFTAQAKIYEEGVVTVIVRVKARLSFEELHLLKARTILDSGRALTLESFAKESFERVLEAIKPAVDAPHERCDVETYTAFCLLDCAEDPASFLARNRDYAAALLIGEDSDSQLHESQIEATLGEPYSYHKGDLAVFDMDRCLIIDSAADYEDLLLMVEHANYQLLELRVLDRLLDDWLDQAEADIRVIYSEAPRRRLPRGSAKMKFAHIQALRFDALFILENLENSSKIIGDYFLGQVYDKLCSIFNTEGWKWSIERRLDTLQSVYDMVKTDTAERRMMALEITFIIVCIIFPILQIVQVMVLSQ